MSDWSDMERAASPLALATGPAQGAAIEMVKSRAAMEAMAAMAHAQRHPRDEAAAYARIMQACKRPGLAEGATYAYSRGGTKVEGPSIRLAETLIRAWGNCNAGVIELNQANGESEMMSFCHDLETNTRIEKVFRVPHVRDTKAGRKDLTDARDVYETTANQASRRLRACILAIIPGDVVDDALVECEKTLRGDTTVPLADRVRKMVAAFAEVGVTPAMIQAKLGHNIDGATNDADLARLRKVYTAIKDGFATAADHFDVGAGAPVAAGNATSVAGLKDALKKPAKSEPSPEEKAAIRAREVAESQ